MVAGQREGRQAIHRQRECAIGERDADQRHAGNVALPDHVAVRVDDEPLAIEMERACRGDRGLLDPHAAQRLDGIDPEFADEDGCHGSLAARS